MMLINADKKHSSRQPGFNITAASQLLTPQQQSAENSLTVATELEKLASAPSSTTRGAEADSLGPFGTETSSFRACRCKSTKLSVLVNWVAYPVHSGVIAYSVVARINKDDFIELMNGILSNPVTVKYSHVAADLLADTLFSDRPKIASRFLFTDTLMFRLSVYDTFPHILLTISTTNAYTVNHETLFRLVTETSSFVRARRSTCAMNGRQVSVLPAAHAQQEAHDIGLLLPPQLL